MACHFYTYLLKILTYLLKIDLIDWFIFYMTLFNIASGIYKHNALFPEEINKIVSSYLLSL